MSDEWMGWMKVDGYVHNRQMNGYKDEWIMSEWMDELVDELIDEKLDEWAQYMNE